MESLKCQPPDFKSQTKYKIDEMERNRLHDQPISKFSLKLVYSSE